MGLEENDSWFCRVLSPRCRSDNPDEVWPGGRVPYQGRPLHADYGQIYRILAGQQVGMAGILRCRGCPIPELVVPELRVSGRSISKGNREGRWAGSWYGIEVGG